MKYVCPKCGDHTVVSEKKVEANGPPLCGRCKKKVQVKADDGTVKWDYLHVEMVKS